jgi:hypothetical protein
MVNRDSDRNGFHSEIVVFSVTYLKYAKIFTWSTASETGQNGGYLVNPGNSDKMGIKVSTGETP